MNPDHKQSVLTTVLALVTALAAVVGAIGGLIATIYATDGGDPAATPTPAPAVSSKTPAPTTPTPSPTPAAEVRRSTPTPAVIEIAPEADSWWGSPATSSGDEEGDKRGEDEELVLDWGCSDDSRGNGSKRECGSGTVALQFDLSDLPDDVTIDEAFLRLYAADGSGTEMSVYARRATSGWPEDGSTAPDCDSRDEAAGEATGDDWAWDVTTIVRDRDAGGTASVAFCLVLKDEAAVQFVSREGAASRAPALTITYRRAASDS